MTGEFTWGYKATSAPAGDSSGFGVDYSNINFAASEDLGGGTALALSMGLDGADRTGDGSAGAVTGVDAKLTLTNGASKLLLASMRNDDYLSEGVAAAAGATWIDLDGYVFSAHTNSQRIEYSYAFGPVSLGYQFLQSSAFPNEGTGLTGNSTGQNRNLIQATYTAGALVANAGYGAYTNKTDGSTASNESITRISASYDLGVAKVGGGYVNGKKSKGSVNDTYLAVGVPLGALDLGLDWGSRKLDTDGAGANDGTVSAYGIGAAYHLSKRTQLVANYRSWESAVGVNTRSTDTRLYIDHSF
jgi:predicted porin